ncbi:MAG: hypothetical protein ACLRIS_00520 [Flavonifractor plautii]
MDVASREWIEEAVESYEGNLLFVSRPLLHQPLCHPYLDAGERTDH